MRLSEMGMLCCNEREDSLPSCHKLMPGQGPTDGTFKCTGYPFGIPFAAQSNSLKKMSFSEIDAMRLQSDVLWWWCHCRGSLHCGNEENSRETCCRWETFTL